MASIPGTWGSECCFLGGSWAVPTTCPRFNFEASVPLRRREDLSRDEVKRGAGRRCPFSLSPQTRSQQAFLQSSKRLLKGSPWHVARMSKTVSGPWFLSLPHSRVPFPRTSLLPRRRSERAVGFLEAFLAGGISFPGVFSPHSANNTGRTAPQSLSRMDRVWDLRCALRYRG